MPQRGAPSQPLTYDEAIKRGGKPLTMQDALAQGGKVVGGEDTDATKAAQKTKYPSSQEKNHNNKGFDESGAGRFATNFLAGANKTTAPLHSPVETIKSIPQMLSGMADPKNSALQATAARERGEASPDPYGLLPLTDAAAAGDLPTVGGEVGGQLAGVGLTTLATGAGAKAAAPYVKAGKTALAGGIRKTVHGVKDAFRPPPAVTALRALADNDPEMLTAHIPKALDEIKAWEATTGETANTAVKQRAALSNRLSATNQEFSRIAAVQRDVPVPGSRAKSIQAQIEAIPEDIRTTKPQQYQNLVNSIQRQAELPDFTIGQLDDVRQSLGTKNASYGKDASHQIAASHSTKAIDAALENFARKAQYEAMDWNIAGTGVDGAELKSRVGAMINYDDALFKKMNKSILQSSQPLLARATSLAGKILSPGKTLRDLGEGKNVPINADLASAARRWKGLPEAIDPLTAPTPPQSGPQPGVNWKDAQPQPELFPSGSPIAEPLLAPPAGTSNAIGEEIFKVQQRTPKYQSSIAGEPAGPGVSITSGEPGIPTTPEQEFRPTAVFRDWANRPLVGASENTWPKPTPEGAQGGLPGEAFKPRQSTAESFYPGKSGVVQELDAAGNTIERDYSQQPHLFGLAPGATEISSLNRTLMRRGVEPVPTPQHPLFPSAESLTLAERDMLETGRLGTRAAERIRNLAGGQ